MRRMSQKCQSCIDTEERIQCSLNSMSDHKEDKIFKVKVSVQSEDGGHNRESQIEA